MKIHYILLLVIIGGISIGTASALEIHSNPPVIVQGGNLNIVDGGMIFTRTDGVQTGLTLQNDIAQTAITFTDTDTGSQYILRHTSDGSRFDFLDFDGVSARVDLTIQRSTGNIGIGTVNPTEELEVNGDIHLSGVNSKITSTGDLCIGNCP